MSFRRNASGDPLTPLFVLPRADLAFPEYDAGSKTGSHTKTTCRWQQPTSVDGGKTWVTDWLMDWTRV